MDDTVGAAGRGGVAGKPPIGMRYEPGVVGGVVGRYPIGTRYVSGVVGKHPIGIPGVACRKHCVCAQIEVGAIASMAEFSQAE